MVSSEFFPEVPSFSEDEMRRYRETGDYAPILFEWYKFVGSLCALVGHIQRDSPAFRAIPRLHYHVLIGLLNRCARLMLANVALSYEGRFGETTAIIDRCIFESAIKIRWLSTDPAQVKFTRYLADGLKTELEFKAQIEANIASRGGSELPIETRMLRSIGNHIAAAEMTEGEVKLAKKLPNLASMMGELGIGRLFYIVFHKIGSHHIHGTWPSLLTHYLEEDDKGKPFEFAPRGHDCDMDINQFAVIPLIVLGAMRAYVQHTFEECEDVAAFIRSFDGAKDEIMKVYLEATEGRE